MINRVVPDFDRVRGSALGDLIKDGVDVYVIKTYAGGGVIAYRLLASERIAHGEDCGSFELLVRSPAGGTLTQLCQRANQLVLVCLIRCSGAADDAKS